MRKVAILGFLLVAQGAMASVCDIENDGQNFYAVTRDGVHFTNWTHKGDYISAIKTRDEAVEAKICTLPTELGVCDIANDGQNFFTVTRDGVHFTNWTHKGDYKHAIAEMAILVQNKVCIKKEANKSVCDIENDGQNFYAVTRDGFHFSNWTSKGDLKSAIQMRDELVSLGLCIKM